MRSVHSVPLAIMLPVGGVSPAKAQTPLDVFVNLNLRVQPSARTFQVSTSPIVYVETAPISSRDGIDGSPVVGLQAGCRATVLGLAGCLRGFTGPSSRRRPRP